MQIKSSNIDTCIQLHEDFMGTMTKRDAQKELKNLLALAADGIRFRELALNKTEEKNNED